MRTYPMTLLIATAGVISACGSDAPAGGPATAAPTGGAARASAVDRCLVGAWRSTSVTGRVTIAGARVSLGGGAGELLIMGSDGTIRTDETSTAPVAGTAAGGTVYRLVQRGVATGTVAGAGGRLTVSLSQPTSLTVTLYRNGSVVQNQHPGSATDSYTCTPRASLVITGSGGTVTRYAPA